MTDQNPLDDDDTLLEMLAAALAATDGPPEHVLAAARAVPDLAGLDAELALLSFDSELDPAGVRSAGEVRQLSFESDGVDVEVVISTEQRDGHLVAVLDGQIVPGRPADVVLMSADPAIERVTTEADELGRFRCRSVPAGAVRLVVTDPSAPDGSLRPVVTSWFRC